MVATPPCPVHVVGTRVVDAAGRAVYRDPGHRIVRAEVKCAGRTVWVVFHNGGAASQEAYVGIRSGDRGRTWRRVFAERYFGVAAPHQLDAYSGPWTLAGPHAAYFTGRCPACGYGTVSLWTTRDGGSFRRIRLPTLTGYEASAIRVSGDDVTITARRMIRGGPATKTVTVAVPQP